MRLNFPNAPAADETWLAPTGITYRWDAVKGVWTTVNIPAGGEQPAATPPGWRRLQRVLTGGQSSINFTNIPADINDLEFRFDVSPTISPQDFVLQFIDGLTGDPINSGYGWTCVQWGNTQSAGAAPGVWNNVSQAYSAGIILNGSIGGNRVSFDIKGRGSIYNIRGFRSMALSWNCIFVEQTGTVLMGIRGEGQHGAPIMFGGFRLLFGSSTVGSGVITLWGSP